MVKNEWQTAQAVRHIKIPMYETHNIESTIVYVLWEGQDVILYNADLPMDGIIL